MRRTVARPSVGRAAVVGVSKDQRAKATCKPSGENVETVLDEQGNGRILHRPDGTIVWEPLPEGHEVPKSLATIAAKKGIAMLELMATVGLAMSGVVAAMSTIQQVDRAYKHGTVLTSGQLTRAVAQTVASTIAGMLTGVVLGPVRAATHLAGMAVRPAIVGLLAHRGATWAQRSFSGTLFLIRHLKSGDLRKQLEALGRIVAKAMSNEAFRKEFERYSGIELLLKLLSDALAQAAGPGGGPGLLPAGSTSSPLMQLLLQALEALLRSPECRDSCIRAGGVPTILKVLSITTVSQDPATAAAAAAASAVRDATGTSSRLRRDAGSSSPAMLMTSGGSSPMRMRRSSSSSGSYGSSSYGSSSSMSLLDAPTISTANVTLAALGCLSHISAHAAGREAIREAQGIPVILGVLSRHLASDAEAAQGVFLVQVLAVDSAAKEAIGSAGGVPIVLNVITAAAPKSQVKLDAIAALHTLLRGSPENQLALAQVPGSFSSLHASDLGACWHPSKVDLHALLNILSRFPQSMPCHSCGNGAAAPEDAAGPSALEPAA